MFRSLALGFSAILAGCAHHTGPAVDPTAAYAAAVKDAAEAEPGEVSTALVALDPTNTALRWRDGRVLLVTWTSWNGYDEAVGTETTLGREVWATAVPQLAEACAGWGSGPDLVLRLEQYLGLPPGNGKDRFVELWADPRDVFRPCPDPEVNDRTCGLGFPVSPRFVVVSPEHVTWFEDLARSSYGEGGYPWTRLGYTYDWGNPVSEVGASEFVIAAGARVGVEAVVPTNAYCGGSTP